MSNHIYLNQTAAPLFCCRAEPQQLRIKNLEYPNVKSQAFTGVFCLFVCLEFLVPCG